MSFDNYAGPRMLSDDHSAAHTIRAGAYQYPALDTDGAVVDLSAWKNEYVELSWYPVDGVVLLYGFFKTAEEADPAEGTAFDTTTSSDDVVGEEPVGKIANAPARLSGSREAIRITVPPSHPFLRIEAASGTGWCLVRHAEG